MKKINFYNFFIVISISTITIGFVLRLNISLFSCVNFYTSTLVYAAGHILLSLTALISYISADKFNKRTESWKIPVGILFGLYGIFILNKTLNEYKIIITILLSLCFIFLYGGYLYQKRKR